MTYFFIHLIIVMFSTMCYGADLSNREKNIVSKIYVTFANSTKKIECDVDRLKRLSPLFHAVLDDVNVMRQELALLKTEKIQSSLQETHTGESHILPLIIEPGTFKNILDLYASIEKDGINKEKTIEEVLESCISFSLHDYIQLADAADYLEMNDLEKECQNNIMRHIVAFKWRQSPSKKQWEQLCHIKSPFFNRAVVNQYIYLNKGVLSELVQKKDYLLGTDIYAAYSHGSDTVMLKYSNDCIFQSNVFYGAYCLKTSRLDRNIKPYTHNSLTLLAKVDAFGQSIDKNKYPYFLGTCHGDIIHYIDYNERLQHIFTICDKNILCFWNAANMHLIGTQRLPLIRDSIIKAFYMPHGKSLIVCSSGYSIYNYLLNDNGTIDAKISPEKFVLSDYRSALENLYAHPSNQFLIGNFYFGSVFLIHLNKQESEPIKIIGSLQDRNLHGIESSLTSNNKYICWYLDCYMSEGVMVKKIDNSDLDCISMKDKHKATALILNPQYEELLLSGHQDGSIYVWNIATKYSIKIPTHSSVDCLHALYNTESGTNVPGHACCTPIKKIFISEDGNTMCVAQTKRVTSYDLSSINRALTATNVKALKDVLDNHAQIPAQDFNGRYALGTHNLCNRHCKMIGICISVCTFVSIVASGLTGMVLYSDLGSA